MARIRVTQHRDFDAAWSERERPSIKAFGETILLPAGPPASLILEIVAIQESGIDIDSEADFEMLQTLLSSVFGPDRVKRWLQEEAMDLDQMSDLFQFMMECWGSEGNANGPETAETTNSPS